MLCTRRKDVLLFVRDYAKPDCLWKSGRNGSFKSYTILQFLQKDDNVYSNLLLSCSFVSRSFERQHNYIFLLIYSLIMEGSKSVSFNENEVYEKYSKIYCVRYYTKTIAKITLSTDF